MEESSSYKDYLAGLLAGVATVIIGHPFDTVKIAGNVDGSFVITIQSHWFLTNDSYILQQGMKPHMLTCAIPRYSASALDLDISACFMLCQVKMQKQNTDIHGIKYRSGLHCTARVLQTEGVKGLYRGATSSFLGVAFESSLLFGIYSQIKQSLEGGLQSGKPQPSVIIPSAAIGGGIISFVLCPSELVKCRMQVLGTDSLVPKSSRYNGPLDCALKTVETEGVTGIFRGGFTTLLRESIGNAVFFSTYESVRYYMHLQLKDASSNQNNLTDVGVGIMSGGLSGIAFWSAVLPFDVAKTIIQTAPDRNSTRNPFQILKSIYRRSGLKGCYTGLGPTIVRAFPANAAAIVTWELAVKILGVKRE